MKVSILGMGAFGIALTKMLNKEVKISMWTNFEDELKSVELKRENTIVLPNVKIDNKVELTTDLEKCVKNSDVIFFAVPAVAFRTVAKKVSKYITKSHVLCILTKGIEKATGMFMSEILEEEIESSNICILCGPSFAIDVANMNTLGMVVSGKSEIDRQKVISLLNKKRVELTQTSDVIGVEISSSTKNVFAIICGMMNGMNLSDSTKAAILTNIISDFRLIIGILGGKESTFYSFSGIGDLLLTCMSPKSRNYTFGTFLGKGEKLEFILENMKVKTIEGLYTLDTLYDILKQKQIVINSINVLYDVIYNNREVKDLLKEISN